MAPFPDDEPTREAITSGATGYLAAWDPVERRDVWRVERAGAWNGGTLVTAGGLVFQGTVDGIFQAIDAQTGTVLWLHDNQAATLADPITYEVDDEQYVTVLAGFGSVFYLLAGALLPDPGAQVNGRVYTFKMGGTTIATRIDLTPGPVPTPPVLEVSPAGFFDGALVFSRFCASCHGIGAISGGVLPDLRRSPALQSADAWRDIVIGGSRVSAGMASLENIVTPESAELVRAYVARQAWLLYDASPGPGGG